MQLLNLLKRPKNSLPARVIIKWLWNTWRGNRLQAALNAIIGMAQVAVSLLQVWAVKNAIDVASHARGGNLYMAVAIMGALIICNFALSTAATWVRNILGVRAQNKMQRKVLERLFMAQWHGKEIMHSGDVLNRLETDVCKIVSFLTETIPAALSVLLLFIGAFVFLCSMSATLAILIVALIPIYLLLSRIYIGKMRTLTHCVRKSDSMVQSLLQESVQNRMIIKTLEGTEQIVGRLQHSQEELQNNVIRRTKYSLYSGLIVRMGFSIGYLIAFLWAAIGLFNASITFGGMTAFLQLVNRIQQPAKSLAQLIPTFVAVITSTERIMQLEEIPLDLQGEPIPIDSPCGIALNNVSYAYQDGQENVIKNLSFDFKPGTCTAILGETGVGKTTLVRLLLALITPNSGNIDIYNKHEKHSLSALNRCNFVYVPQGNTLLSGTIRDNLRLGKEDATEKEMLEALKKSCADFVMHLPNKLDSVCSEDGGGLSEGQAQRISIARALLRNRSVLLFDEATSALDVETEKQLLKNILDSNNKTIIFITHRLAVVDYCTQVLNLSDKNKWLSRKKVGIKHTVSLI